VCSSDLVGRREERKKIFSSSEHNDWTPPATWHEAALRKAGFTEVGLAWRGGTDAAVVGLRSADAA